jgi:hypothetical protein
MIAVAPEVGSAQPFSPSRPWRVMERMPLVDADGKPGGRCDRFGARRCCRFVAHRSKCACNQTLRGIPLSVTHRLIHIFCAQLSPKCHVIGGNPHRIREVQTIPRGITAGFPPDGPAHGSPRMPWRQWPKPPKENAHASHAGAVAPLPRPNERSSRPYSTGAGFRAAPIKYRPRTGPKIFTKPYWQPTDPSSCSIGDTRRRGRRDIANEKENAGSAKDRPVPRRQ